MKYGETLRQRSIPAWSHYNIDYDDIKRFIKDRTTPGLGKTVAVPGRPDEKLRDFEASLFSILADQHQRIDLFVKSKAGEIQRRLDHAKRQLRQLSSRQTSAAAQRVPIARLDRYSRLESDLLKAGDELRSLARFTATQRTAFRKLLKKYKKWTGSTDLEKRMRDELLDDPKSFTNLDFGPMLDEYSDMLQEIRGLFDMRPATDVGRSGASGSSAVDRLTSAMSNSSPVDLDVALDTVPLGDGGGLASYFIHPENVVELQVFLLKHFRYYTPRSRSNSITPPVSPLKRKDSSAAPAIHQNPDYFLLAADNPDRFAQEQAAITVSEREQGAGVMPQKPKLCIRWNSNEGPVLSAKSGRSRPDIAPLKEKHIKAFFDKSTSLAHRRVSISGDAVQDLDELRDRVLKDPSVQPLYQISTCRSRLVGIGNTQQRLVLGTLDTGIAMREVKSDGEVAAESVGFPFALLQIRQEGAASSTPLDVVAVLDHSHLAERVRGFSLQYHALWAVCHPARVASPPFWMPLLERDIRKLPPPALPFGSNTNSLSSPPNSSVGATDSTTAVDTSALPSSADAPVGLDPASSTASRKNRRRQLAASAFSSRPLSPPPQRYWSEYDHPEDGEDGDGGYIIYIDPNERSALERFFDKMGRVFWSDSKLGGEGRSIPDSPREDETSSDEDDSRTSLMRGSRAGYGTVYAKGPASGPQPFGAQLTTTTSRVSSHHSQPAPRITTLCLAASLVILIIASFLAATSKRRLARQADAAVVFAIAASLAFAITGLASLLRRSPDVPLLGWVTAALVVIVDAVWAGALLAHIVG